MLVKDQVYGNFEIKEAVLIELIHSKAVQRLKGISQCGLPAKYCTQPVFSRYDHSIGVFILLRKLGAGIEEQIAGLLHDISHTAFSHLVDWVVGDPKVQDYQDNLYSTILEKSDCADILEKHGFSVSDFFDLEKYSLLERESPDLCVDRIDYCLRDLVSRGGKVLTDKIVDCLVVDNGMVGFDSPLMAYCFAHEFAALQRYSWSEISHSTRFSIFAGILERALKLDIISEGDFEKTDNEVLNILELSDDNQIKESLDLLKKGFTFENSCKGFKIQDKFRFVDPGIFLEGKFERLSKVIPTYSGFLDFQKKYYVSDKYVEVSQKW